LRGNFGVEAQSWSRSVAEWDRAEQRSVFVDPFAGEPEAPCELFGIDQFWRLARAVVEGLRLVAEKLRDTLGDLLNRVRG
jgi:hypothetical protein